MRILVTGAGGFVGKHLVDLLQQRGHQVYAGFYSRENLFDHRVTNIKLDVLDMNYVAGVLKDIQPDGIVHLAAQSNVKVSWESPTLTTQMNIVSLINIMEGMKIACPKAKLLSIGSSEEYGSAGRTGEILTEDSPCQPQNPYAVSKYAAGQLALQLGAKDHINVAHVRPFNHFGPGQHLGFVVSDFSSQIVQIERGNIEPILKVGNLGSYRDFTDVRDIVRAYAMLLESEFNTGIYNICSETPREINSILNSLVRNANVHIEVQIDPNKFRTIDVPMYRGSSEKLRRVITWEPTMEFESSLVETLNWWRNN